MRPQLPPTFKRTLFNPTNKDVSSQAMGRKRQNNRRHRAHAARLEAAARLGVQNFNPGDHSPTEDADVLEVPLELSPILTPGGSVSYGRIAKPFGQQGYATPPLANHQTVPYASWCVFTRNVGSSSGTSSTCTPPTSAIAIHLGALRRRSRVTNFEGPTGSPPSPSAPPSLLLRTERSTTIFRNEVVKNFASVYT